MCAIGDSWLNVVKVLWAWIIFANKAEPKSKEKWWIFLVNDYFINFISQFIMSWSRKIGTTVSLTEHFWSKAKQNLWMTDPFFSYSIIYFLNIVYFNDFLNNSHVLLVSYIFDPPQSTAYDTDQGNDCISEFRIWVFEQRK